MIIGNLGRDPEIKYTQSNVPVANFSVATSESWKDKNSGEWQEKTEWHRVVIFGKVAEVAGEYLRKGSQVYIEGKLRTRKWQDRDGNDRWTTEIVADEMQMLGGRGGAAPMGSGQGMGQGSSQDSGPPSAPPQTGPDDFDDDIPF